MIKKDNRSKCRNCRVGLTCSKCGRNHNDKRSDYYPSVDVARVTKNPGILGVATRDICECEDTVIVEL